jgi:hypothetical protein
MIYSGQPFASPGEALAHFGVKGMKWGVRKDRLIADSSSKASSSSEAKKAARRRNVKKAAIGVGVLTAVAGGAYVAYRLNQNGNLPISSLKKAKKTSATEKAIKKVLDEPTNILHASRGKTKGFSFFKTGDLAEPYPAYEKAFGKDSFTDNLFERHDGGKIAASFLDPEGRRDQSGRSIPHQVIIPKSMSTGINNMDDVKKHIWPLLKETYDER